MAITKIWKVSNRLDHVINYANDEEKISLSTYESKAKSDLESSIYYAINPKKTEKQLYVSSLNCLVDTALEEMNITKKQFNKRDGIIAFHGCQSFAENEVTPEIAHEIGKRLSEEMWGDRFEVIISTHLNTKHIHNHFVINSVSFKDGKKYYDNHENYALLRATSDAVCEEYGLNIIKEKQCKRSKINYENFMKKYQKSPYYITTQEDIDRAIRQAYSYKDFENILKAMDYDIRYRAGRLSVCRKDKKRNIRIERAFGKRYSIEAINERILVEKEIRVPFQEEYSRVYKPKRKRIYKKLQSKSGIQKLYLYYGYKLKIAKKKSTYKPMSQEQKNEIQKMDKLSEKAKFLHSRNINTVQELSLYKEALKSELEMLQLEKKKVLNELEKTKERRIPEEQFYKLIEDRKEFRQKIKAVRLEVRRCNEILDELPKIKEKLEDDENRKELERNEHIRSSSR